MNEDIQDVIRQFEVLNKRKPRILHIGNIAANAYNNSKLLIELGFDSHVLCVNYYHIMGCPEWEDAIVDGHIIDHFRPDWTSVNLNGFSRPDWFVQGPLMLCIEYLLAFNENNIRRKIKLKKTLQIVNNTSNTSVTDAVINKPSSRWLFNVLDQLRKTSEATAWSFMGFLERFVRIINDPVSLAHKLATYVPARIKKPNSRMGFLFNKTFKKIQKAIICLCEFITYDIRFSLILNRLFFIKKITGKPFSDIESDYQRFFDIKPDKHFQISTSGFSDVSRKMEKLFNQYDLIQAYSIDPIYPYLSGKQYFAFEHGTLRSIPFDGSVTGSLTALAYANAEHVFVTNTDCIDNAKKINPERYTVIPHPFDERRMNNVGDWKALREELCNKMDADFLIFYPTRHDWVEGNGFNDKANDVFIRAFSKLTNHYRVGLICCRWGHNVDESEQLLIRLNCSDNVMWVEPMCVRKYEKMMKACHVIADQFKLGAFGGVTFRGLAAGRPVCTYLNCEEIELAYNECPPVINCKTEEEIYTQLDKVFGSNSLLRTIGEQSEKWIAEHHSGMETAKIQARQYCKHLVKKMTLPA